MRLGVPDDGAEAQAEGPVHVRRRPLHRLPLLHAGPARGRADRGLGHARAEDRQVHALLGPHRPAAARSRATASRSTRRRQRIHVQKIAVPACVKACPADALVYGERERCSPRRASASPPPRPVRGPHLRRAGGGRHERALHIQVPFAKLGFPDVGTKSYPRFSNTRLAAVPPRRHGVGRGCSALMYAFLKRRTAAMAGAAAGGSAAHTRITGHSSASTPS